MQVVCCTLTGALGRHLEGEAGKFDVVFVDEAAQVLDAIARKSSELSNMRQHVGGAEERKGPASKGIHERQS